MRVEAEHRAAAQLGGPFLHGADVEIAVLDRPGKVPFLERRPHRDALVERNGAAEHQRFGPAADPRAQGPDDDVGGPRLGQLDSADLAAAGLSQPERLGDSVPGARAAVLSTRLSHDGTDSEATRDLLSADWRPSFDASASSGRWRPDGTVAWGGGGTSIGVEAAATF